MGYNPNWQNDYAQQGGRNNNGYNGNRNNSYGNNGYGGNRNNGNGGQNGGYRNNYGGQNSGNRNNHGGQNGGYRNTLPPKLDAEALPSDYVEKAEDVIRVVVGKDKRDQITTSKLRNLYSLVTDILNLEQLHTGETLQSVSVTGLQRMRVRLAYESGREEATRIFVEEAKLIPYLKWIGTDRAKLMRFAHYMEALVAYHRFYHVGNEK